MLDWIWMMDGKQSVGITGDAEGFIFGAAIHTRGRVACAPRKKTTVPSRAEKLFFA
jgi:hypothetical protein